MRVAKEKCRRKRLLQELHALGAAVGCVLGLLRVRLGEVSAELAEGLAVGTRDAADRLAQVHHDLQVALGEAGASGPPVIVAGGEARR